MAGDWIKMRGALLDHPKVIAIARALHTNRDFREWLTPGGSGPMNGQIPSDAALRCVTVSLLMKVWSGSREHGVFAENDLHLRYSVVDDLDQMAGVPGIGEAMASVRWVVEKPGEDGIFLPNFKEFNVPMTPAEKQSAYRKRKLASVTKALPNKSNKSGTREEKRREEEEPSLRSGSIAYPSGDSNPENPTPPPQENTRQPRPRTIAVSILEFLNERTGKAFQPTDANVDLIIARLKEGYSPAQCRQVVVRKVREWASDDKMAGYLRPATLFNREKFNQYAGELVASTAETAP